MDKQQLSIKYLGSLGFKTLLVFFLFTGIFACKKDPEHTHRFFIENNTSYDLVFHLRRASGLLVKDFVIPSNQKTLFGGGALHFSTPDVIFKVINEYYGLPTDTVEILRNGEFVIKWGGPLRAMDASTNHFYNELSWDIMMGGPNNKYERATFTIYESDLGIIEGN